MKDVYKLIIGAIIVILLLLAGAFALSGSNSPQPTATPAVLPATVTPTPTPTGSGDTGGAPTATPIATPVPAITPTPMPESGVKLTEFGYWITYPPLPPQNWSSPKPLPEWNVVYFDPTSDTLAVHKYVEGADFYHTEATVHRVGDLNGTITVGLCVSPTDNLVHAVDYQAYYYVWSPDLTPVTDTYYNLTFGPGVSERTINIGVSGLFNNTGPGVMTPDGDNYRGNIQIDIVEVDGGYAIGSRHLFDLDIEEFPTVFFEHRAGCVFGGSGGFPSSGAIDDVLPGDETVTVLIVVDRYTDEGAMPVSFHLDYYHPVPDGTATLLPFSFTDGDREGRIMVVIDKEYLANSENTNRIQIIIDASPNYAIEHYEYFDLFINEEP